MRRRTRESPVAWDLRMGPSLKARFAVEVRVGLGLVDVLEDRSSVEGDYRVLTLLFAVTPTR